MMTRRFLGSRRPILSTRALALGGLTVLALLSTHRLGALLVLPGVLATALSVQVVRPVDGPGRRVRVRVPGEQLLASRWLPPLWVLASLPLLVLPIWVATDLPDLLRCLGLALAMVVLISTITDALVAPHWFDPAVRDRPASEVLRRVVGQLTAVVTTLLVLWGPWPSGLTVAGCALGLLPLVSVLRLFHLERTLEQVIPVIRQAGQLGRDQVLREIHGALSTELRQLEQYARRTRLESPDAYELAVNANSSLRETLTLTDESRETSTTTDTLLAPVLTLTRAVGASASAQIDVDDLSLRDREVARYVLNELAGLALKAGAFHLALGVRRDTRWVDVELRGTGAGPWSEVVPTQLEHKLAALSGELSREASAESTLVRARWPVGS